MASQSSTLAWKIPWTDGTFVSCQDLHKLYLCSILKKHFVQHFHLPVGTVAHFSN